MRKTDWFFFCFFLRFVFVTKGKYERVQNSAVSRHFVKLFPCVKLWFVSLQPDPVPQTMIATRTLKHAALMCANLQFVLSLDNVPMDQLATATAVKVHTFSCSISLKPSHTQCRLQVANGKTDAQVNAHLWAKTSAAKKILATNFAGAPVGAACNSRSNTAQCTTGQICEGSACARS